MLLVALLTVSCSKCSPTTRTTATPEWLAGAYVPEETKTPRRGGSLTVRLPTEPLGFTRFHDRLGDGLTVRATTGTIYESLARLDPEHPDGPVVPLLAKSAKVVKAQLEVELAPGIVFHDGSAFTSADVKAVFETILDEQNPTVSMRSSLGPIELVTVTDDLHLTITWKSPPSDFMVRTALAAIPMMPSEALVGPFDELPIHRAPIGTGPFRFESFTPGERVVLARVEGHRMPAQLDRLVLRIVKDDTVAVQLWEKGELDVMTRIPAATWVAVETAAWAFKGYQRWRIDENAYSWIGWNRQRPVFGDVRVRRALAMLYPAEIVSRSVELGLESRTACPFYVRSQSCDPSVVPLPFDPKAAGALLDEAGWPLVDGHRTKDGKRLEFSFLVVTTSQRLSRVVALFQEQLSKAGITMTLEPVDGAQLIGRMRTHDFDAAALSWSSPDAVTDQYELFHSSQIEGGKNYVGLNDPEVDALLVQIRGTLGKERRTLEQQLHRKLFDDQVYLFLTARPALDAVKRSVHGLRPSLVGYDFSKAWIDP